MYKPSGLFIGLVVGFIGIVIVAASFGAGMMLQSAIDRHHTPAMQRPDPNNVYTMEYKLALNEEYYVLLDGQRVVDTIDVGKCPVLDTVIMKDNE